MLYIDELLLVITFPFCPIVEYGRITLMVILIKVNFCFFKVNNLISQGFVGFCDLLYTDCLMRTFFMKFINQYLFFLFI